MFVSTKFSSKLVLPNNYLECKLHVDTHTKGNLVTNQICRSCLVHVEGRQLLENLVILEMHDFDIILGMDLLTQYYANFNCHDKRVEYQIHR